MKTTFTMDGSAKSKFERGFGIFARAWSYLVALTALVVIPLSLWSAWVYRFSAAVLAVETVFHLSWSWALVSLLQFLRGLRKLKLSASERMRLFSGRRPVDADGLFVWKWGWQFAYAVIAVLLSTIAIPVTAWLARK